jgi:hypothetical protein
MRQYVRKTSFEAGYVWYMFFQGWRLSFASQIF